MKLSWSHKLFFFLNRQHGKWPWVDAAMEFSAKYVIFLLVVSAVLFAFLVLAGGSIAVFQLFVEETLFLLVTALSTSYVIGWIVPHRRPIREFPKTHLLFHTMKTWKSFPSDHTIVSFSIWGMVAWFTWFSVDRLGRIEYSSSIMLVLLGLFLAACLVALGRIYCGVHYPRDIVGGILLSVFYIWLFQASRLWWDILSANGVLIALALVVILLVGYQRRIRRFVFTLIRKQ